MINLYPVARTLLFQLEAEAAHHLALSQLQALESSGLLKHLLDKPVADPITVMGLRLFNRVGLAAGLDKQAAHIDAFARLGFGFIEVGTVTPRAQPGNPKPRMFRLKNHQALINRLGFNNEGLDAFLCHVRARQWQGPIGLNIGKNASTPIEQADEDYLRCLDAVHAHADYVTVNISSPNTKNLRQLQASDALESLLNKLRKSCDALDARKGSKVPIALKIAPDLEFDQIDEIARLLQRHAIDGVIATNTTLAREQVKDSAHAAEVGGLSGAPLLEASNKVISRLRSALGPDFPIIGVGGILSKEDALQKIKAGANLVQIYTGLIYKGPKLIYETAKYLRDFSSKAMG
ncbi:MAG: quinone-dependent dihydroorotate dehydrogenase [Burkholderiales bacterium]